MHEYRTKREGAGAELPGVESDSFNENISPFKVFFLLEICKANVQSLNKGVPSQQQEEKKVQENGSG